MARRYRPETIQGKLVEIADQLDVLEPQVTALRKQRREWLMAGANATPTKVGYRELASWSRLTSSRVSQIIGRTATT